VGQWTIEDVNRHNAKIGATMPAHVPAKRPKFGNKKTLCDGVLFDSGDEADRYLELKALEALSEIKDLELQPEFDLFACELSSGRGIRVAGFTADFRYFDCIQNRQRVEDVKSEATRTETAYRLRKKLAEACHGVEIEEVIR
jgi:hypothetical protein